MAKITITPSLVKDLKKYSEQMCVGMAAQVRDELTKTTASAIEAFYDDYSPVSYRRHYYNFRNNSFEKFYKNPHGGIVRGGVYLTPDGLDDLYEQDTEIVFGYFYAGYHGMPSSYLSGSGKQTVIPKMDPSPMDLILIRRENIVNAIHNYEKYGYSRANKGNYSTFSYM